jgi:hypothetical protein
MGSSTHLPVEGAFHDGWSKELSIRAVEEQKGRMAHRYAAEIADLSKKLTQAILEKDGDRLMDDPQDVDLEILTLLREVGKKTTGEVTSAVASRLSAREKKAGG